VHHTLVDVIGVAAHESDLSSQSELRIALGERQLGFSPFGEHCSQQHN
jgi:hypothetical protein